MPYIGRAPTSTATKLEDADKDTKIQVEESSDEDTIRFDTGGSERMTVASGGTVDVVGDLTVGTVTADGDTSAGDNATIGYTAAEGLILTGQGTTNDVTIKNDADADVLEIPTGTTNVTVVGDVTAAGLHVTGDTAAADNAAIGYTSAEGLILTGQGSTSDITIKNDADANVMTVATGTTVAAFASAPTGIITDQFKVTGGAQANVTGDGTTYTVVFASTEIYDAGGVFTTSTYTASATGKAHLNYMIELGPFGSSHTRFMSRIETSNGTYIGHDVNAYILTGGGSSTYNRWCASFICDMDASDTAYVTLYSTGSNKILDISSGRDCQFSGFLIKD